MTRVVNMFGGPDAGKSTNAAALFYRLKLAGANVEYVPEFAKDKVWEKSFHVLDNQLYILAKQHHRLFRLLNEVDIIVTDSPLLLSLIYGEKQSSIFKALVVETFNTFTNINFFLERTKTYDPRGRMQTEPEAKILDTKIKNMLRLHDIHHIDIIANSDAVDEMFQIIIDSGIKIES